jgi:hypothetical protein
VPEPVDHLKLQACTTSKGNNHHSFVSRSPNVKLAILLFACITKRIYGHVTTELRNRQSYTYTHTLFTVHTERYDFQPVIILLTLASFCFLCVATQNCPFMAHSPVLQAYQWLASQLSPHTVTYLGVTIDEVWIREWIY